MTIAEVRAAAERWLADDPDPETRAETQTLLDVDDRTGLADRFAARLTFGTAGIRGTLGPGPNRMNRALVRRVTAGLAARLLEDEGAAECGVVVGRDARHGSAEFAEDAARVLAGVGITVHRCPGVVPTPLLAYAVRALGAAGGVMITASHNPATDNGYKVYWGDGAQITAPLDGEIAAAIDATGPLGDVPLADRGDARIRHVDPSVTAAYLDEVLALQLHPESRDLAIAYTPLHGVAGELQTRVLVSAGFRDVQVVASQAEPDPDFPTVAFPNPEEPGAMDRVLALAAETGADLVLANDPDGDRFAVAAPGPGSTGGLRLLSGDEAGCLLAEYLLAEGDGGSERVVATTVVSSQLLARIAAAHGVRYVETLTGFKWLARAAADAEANGGRMVVAYEQALGAMVSPAVRDKDGISAGLVFAELAAHLRAGGRSVWDALDDLARRHGVHHTGGTSVRLEGEDGDALVAAALDQVRAAPATVAGTAVVAVADHTSGVRRLADGDEQAIATPATALVGVELADGTRLQVRPSGTEPLLKCYVEVVEPVTDDDVGAARARATERHAAMTAALLDLAGLA